MMHAPHEMEVVVYCGEADVSFTFGCTEGDPCWRPPLDPDAVEPGPDADVPTWCDWFTNSQHCQLDDAIDHGGLLAVQGTVAIPGLDARVVLGEGDEPRLEGPDLMAADLTFTVPVTPVFERGFPDELPHWVGYVGDQG